MTDAEDITTLLRFKRRNRLPIILQAEAAECGLACLAMIASYHGHHLDMPALRQRFPVSSLGINLRQLTNIASRLRLSARGVRVSAESVGLLQIPCILHWDLDHFVVLESVGRHSVIIHDPSRGRHVMPMDLFKQHFTGVALELLPTSDFAPIDEKRHLKLSQLWTRATGVQRSMAHIIVLALILQLFAIASPFYLQLVVDAVIPRGDHGLLAILALGFALLLLIEAGTIWLREMLVLEFANRLNLQMAANLFRHLVRLPMGYFYRRHIGDIVSRFGALNNVRKAISTNLVTAVVDGCMASLTVAVMFVYSPRLALVVVGTFALYGLFRYLAYRPAKLLAHESILAIARQDSHFIETVRAMQTIKVFGRESDRQAKWQNLLADSLNANISIAQWTASYNLVNKLLFGIGGLFVIYLSTRSIIDGNMTIGMLYAFVSYSLRFTESTKSLIDQWIALQIVDVDLERLSDITFTPIENSDSVDHHADASLDSYDLALDGSVGRPPTPSGHIEVRKLSYTYGEGVEPVFKDVNLIVEAGEALAIAGPSGCGKSTLLKCIMGLLEPTSGQILIDGKPMKLVSGYRQRIAAVMQEDQLLAGTIADNIACFDPQIDLREVVRCARHSCIHDDVMAMPMQYNTLVGDMGSAMSGGQKQRVLLARALYRKPSILFMDEATSHLDADNEARVSHNIQDLKITRLLIAHRSETLRQADRIFYMSA